MVNATCDTYETRLEDWETPLGLYNKLDKVFDFTVDLAANEKNHRATEWMGPGGFVEDTLAVDVAKYLPADEWAWCNPPYARKVNGKWATKLMEAPSVVALVPVSTGSQWFRPYWDATAICWVGGRLRFGGAPGTAQFDSALVVKGSLNDDQLDVLSELGRVTMPL